MVDETLEEHFLIHTLVWKGRMSRWISCTGATQTSYRGDTKESGDHQSLVQGGQGPRLHFRGGRSNLLQPYQERGGDEVEEDEVGEEHQHPRRLPK